MLKRGIHFILQIAIIAPLFVFGGCDFDEVDIKTEHFTVLKSQWSWNDIYKRYECGFQSGHLTEAMYKKGKIDAFVEIVERTGEGDEYFVLEPLPFTRFFLDEQRQEYSEIISYNITGDNVWFYIKRSDRSDIRAYLSDYFFKITFLK